MRPRIVDDKLEARVLAADGRVPEEARKIYREGLGLSGVGEKFIFHSEMKKVRTAHPTMNEADFYGYAAKAAVQTSKRLQHHQQQMPILMDKALKVPTGFDL